MGNDLIQIPDFNPPAWVRDPRQAMRTMVLHRFEWADILPIGLSITHRGFSWEQYEQDMHVLLTIQNASQWAIGDAYNAGAMLFRDRDASQVFTARNVRLKTIQNYAWTCHRYMLSQRMFPPSFSHHSIVAKLPHERRVYWLQRSVDEDLVCEELDVMSAEERGIAEADMQPFTLLVRRYNAILRSWELLPDGDVKAGVRRGLKMIEDSLKDMRGG